ncbi:MAG: hypothetical protein GY801_13750 [bacterium]|nr:hypothetical protein [bacterium]
MAWNERSLFILLTGTMQTADVMSRHLTNPALPANQRSRWRPSAPLWRRAALSACWGASAYKLIARQAELKQKAEWWKLDRVRQQLKTPNRWRR